MRGQRRREKSQKQRICGPGCLPAESHAANSAEGEKKGSPGGACVQTGAAGTAESRQENKGIIAGTCLALARCQALCSGFTHSFNSHNSSPRQVLASSFYREENEVLIGRRTFEKVSQPVSGRLWLQIEVFQTPKPSADS